jgi:hypothetical protein
MMMSTNEQTYGDAHLIDYSMYNIKTLATVAAKQCILDFVDYEEATSLQISSLKHYFASFKLDYFSDLQTIRSFLNSPPYSNLIISPAFDSIKCFLRLTSCSGIPFKLVEEPSCVDLDVYCIDLHFKDFIITRTVCEDRFSTNPVSGSVYSINISYSALLLLLSGDVETNPGPIHSKPMTKEQIQYLKIRNLEKELAKMRKIQAKQGNFVQRQVEMEKRDRQRNRKEASNGKRYAEGLFSFARNAGTSAEVIANTVGPTMEMAQTALQNLIDAGSSLKALFDVPNEIDLIGVLVSLFSIGQAITSKQILSLSVHVIQLARLIGVSLSSLMLLIPKEASVEPISDEVTTGLFYSGESVDDDVEMVRVSHSLVTDMIKDACTSSSHLLPFTGFLAFICGIFSFLCSGNMPSPSDMTRHFSNVGRAAHGFRAVKDLFSWLSDYIAEIYYSTVYGLTRDEYQFMLNFPQLENIYAASKIVEKLTKVVIDGSAIIADQILSINHQLNEYAYQASKMNSRSNQNLVTSLQKRMKEQTEWASHSPARCHSIRVEPIALYLYGHPGVGKTVLTDVLKANIFKHYLRDGGTKYESCAFTRRSKNEYWEGYVGQPIVLLDDFGNVKDSQMKPVEEYEELEYMVNTCQFNLKMAELKSKGVSNFTSDFIIASSNQLYPDIKHLTDKGAVFRRFHIWAEVSIDPAYGVPLGCDDKGMPYYTYDVDTVAKLKNCSPEDLDPLMTEHYRLKLYKVHNNKQTGNAVVTPIAGCQSLTFDQYWKHVVKVNDKKKLTGVKLADAIRKVAGIDKPDTPVSELDIITQFDKIFNPDKFLEEVSECCEDADIVGEHFVESLGSEDSIFGSFGSFAQQKNKLHTVKALFDKYKKDCNAQMIGLYSSLKELACNAGNKLISIARFLLSIFQSVAGKVYPYFKSVPVSAIITSVCATIVAVAGVWYTGLFCSDPSLNGKYCCQFATSPSNDNTPCNKCPSCEILQFPRYGCMLLHFLERTGVGAVRKALYALGFQREALENKREEIRKELSTERPVAQSILGKCAILQLANSNFEVETYADSMRIIGCFCWFNCERCDKAKEYTYDAMDNEDCIRCAAEILQEFRSPIAQRVYNNQPAPAKQRSYAQRVYNNQPAPVRKGRFAHGYVDLKTEMHMGARKYAQRDRVQVEQTTQVLLNNSVWIQAVDANGLACRSNGVFLVGRTMITTAHTVMEPPQIDPIVKIIIRNPYSTIPAVTIPFDQCQVSQIKQLDGTPMDLALISFPACVPSRPRILSKFLDANSISLLDEGDLTFSGFYEINGKTIVQEKYPRSFSVSTKNTEYYLHSPGTCPKDPSCCRCPIAIGNHIDYDLETHSGMCGALLSISNNLIHTKLIGFHVAGGAGVLSLGALTTRQLLETALADHIKLFDIRPSYLIDGRLPHSLVDSAVVANLVHVGDCLSLGYTKPPRTPFQTQLGPSLVFDQIQKHITKPAHLTPVMIDGELVDPMEKGIKKVMGTQCWVNPDYLDAAAHDVFTGLGLPPSGTGIVHSYEEAIKGVENDPYKRPVNRTTSPGFPYNMNNKMKGKTHWLGDGENYIVDNPELKHDVELLIEESRQGIRGTAISLATLKDEKRPFEKVDAGKTRVFEACPQHLVLAIRRYFLDFAAHVMRHRIDNGIAVGINPYSLEWTKVAHRLLEKGDHMIAGDFSNFDGSLSMQILVKICEKINEWYSDDLDSQMIRSALWEHICNADVLVRGDVIRQTHSQPSGNPLTVIINSLFNGIAMRVAYLTLKEKENLPLVCDYRKYVNDIIYGDDDIKSVHIEILPWFNQITITEALATFGLTYTDEMKSGAVQPWKRLDDTSFLKRKFVIQNDGTYMAPMEISNILEITNWIKGKAKRASTIENCTQTLMELALHPKKEYDYWSSRVREECAKVRINFPTMTWHEQMAEYRFNRDAAACVEYTPLW